MAKRDELIEAAARAIAKHEWPHVGGSDCDTLTPGTPNWRHKVSVATAALDAILEGMRKPSEGMVLVGTDRMAANNPTPPEAARRCFIAMLDALKAEG